MHPDLKFYIRSLTRFIYVVTDEEDRLIMDLHEALAKVVKRIQVYNSAFGLVPIESLIEDWRSRAHKETPNSTIHDALIQIYRDDPKTEQNYYIITDPGRWLKDAQVVRRILNIAHQLKNNERTVKIMIFVGPRLYIPQELQRYIEVVYDKGLTSEEIRKILEKVSSKVPMTVSESLVKACQGLTGFEIDAATSQNIIATKKDPNAEQRRVDPRFIQEYKRRQLRKTDLVQYIDTSKYSFDNVGGAKRFKAWAESYKANWTEEGQKFGLVPPKGVLLVGMYGCGKSISVNALGSVWRLPVVSLELGKLRQSGVGDSEANVYRAISLIESVAPCIVRVDEAEKSFAGSQSSAQSDAGTTSRMIGILSTWIEEMNANVCLAMTANSLKNLPPEFIRRMNERFFFGLPTEDERIEILKIHLKQLGQDPTKYNLARLAEDSNQMVGSEIKHALEAAMTASFNAEHSCLDEEIFSKELRNKPRISKTLGDEIKEILSWVGYDKERDEGVRARLASDQPDAWFKSHFLSDG